MLRHVGFGFAEVRGDGAVDVGAELSGKPRTIMLYLIDRTRFGDVTNVPESVTRVVVESPGGAEGLREFVQSLPATATSLVVQDVAAEVQVRDLALPATVREVVFNRWAAARLPAVAAPAGLQGFEVGDCANLTELPDLSGVGSLGALTVSNAPRLAALPRLPERLSCLFLTDCGAINFSGDPLPADPGRFVLSLVNCRGVRALPAVRTRQCGLTLVGLPNLTSLRGLEAVGVFDFVHLSALPELAFRVADHLRVLRTAEVRIDQRGAPEVEGQHRFGNLDCASVVRYVELAREAPGTRRTGTKTLVDRRGAERYFNADLENAEAMRRAGLPADAAWLVLSFRGR